MRPLFRMHSAPALLLLLTLCAVCQTIETPPHSLTALLDGTGFVAIEPGEFIMGSSAGHPDEQPAHRVRITRGFEIGRFEVTQAQWNAVMRSPHGPTGSADDVNPSHFSKPELPVESVSWTAVQHFVKRLNARDPKHHYRLPTEAEWEYAARAGLPEHTLADRDSVAWYEANSGGRTHPVGEKKPNAWGLYDIFGNVLEWVDDWYAPDTYAETGRTDPAGPGAGSYKVYRGCAWLSSADSCRPSFRGFDFPGSGYYSVGFRLVRTTK